MRSSGNYKHLAAECLRIARDIENPTDRALLVAMAETWARLADQAETREYEQREKLNRMRGRTPRE